MHPAGSRLAAQGEVPPLQWVGQYGGAAQAVALAGNYAYVGIGPHLVILDVSIPSQPVAVGQTAVLPGVVEDVALVEDHAYVCAGGGGLRVISIADRAHPVEVGHLDLSAGAQRIALAGDYACVTSGQNGLRIIRIADATQPTEVAAYATVGPANSIAIAGHYAYVGDTAHHDNGWYGGNVGILDISDPTHPAEVYVLPPGGAGGPRCLTATLDTLYVLADGGWLQIIRVSDPAHPVLLNSVQTGYGKDLLAQGDYVYVAASTGLRVVNVSSPLYAGVVGQYDTPDWAAAVAVEGSRACVTTETGLHVIQVSDPTQPRGVGVYGTAGSASQVATDGHYACIVTARGLRIVDVSNPAAAVEVGVYNSPDEAHAVALRGRSAYLACAGSLRIIDLVNPAHPVQVGYCSIAGYPVGVAVSQRRAYVAAGADSGLRIVDISNPAHPVEIGRLNMTWAGGVALAGPADDYAYVANASSLTVVNVADPQHPALASACWNYGVVWRVAMLGNTALVTFGDRGLRVFDVTDPYHCEETGNADTPGKANDVAVKGLQAYVADSGGACARSTSPTRRIRRSEGTTTRWARR